MRLEPVIGLEIHVQLKTKSKMFCGCSNRGEYEPANTTVCEICLGHPGILPAVNAEAVRFGALVGLALGGKVGGYSKFDRKNYFYPDLPKGYQISQFDLPVVQGGEVAFEVPENGVRRTARVRLTRIHLEEDAAKLQHSADGKSSLVDFNRGGTPLAEIVTEPDFKSPAEAKAFLQELRLIMRYLGVSDADMEKGHLRCDANVSLREVAEQPSDAAVPQLNPKTEVKNINSFRSVERALDYEIKRQTKLWLDGKPPMKQATRGWDDVRGLTVEQRTKEGSSDYRYFPEPDLPPLDLTEMARELAHALPEMPAARRTRFVADYALTPDDARTLCDDLPLADFAEEVFSELQEWATSPTPDGRETKNWEAEKPEFAKLVSGWILTKLNGVMAEHKMDIRTLKITPENFAELLTLIRQKRVTGPNALVILEEMALSGADPSVIMQEKKLESVDDTAELAPIAANVVAANPKAVEDWKSGKTNAAQFLVGQMMRATRGKCPPDMARKLIEEELRRKQ
ncbi:glutaminyl-tRNA synthase (glutamine-hydrolyzing) subunit B [Candidatus Uhrbacteria bacterium RIFCSPHIGHO2_02_FULL_60_10]|uniref:Aspartyl/glutamyl-tRNA(Asn/Gln) amidotransferase subunit B n=1 Tax=Candidatus Uhrbacteria bacterium RIFCSPHIGHO2_02_FULL_60_10 TaxID=1802392 RepID=A0A1F7U5H2_9BACT|nr:MAG: glutaminyl-tRNA synthase (glutamine-hydrolyzing) subunit B [Candidatus Uhrbacteria bacterium RIFCSPHIGHO2_02_FULL_60_10]